MKEIENKAVKEYERVALDFVDFTTQRSNITSARSVLL